MTEEVVHKSITVQASAERAFEVFTKEADTWWPRSHHIGKSPMTRAIIENRKGGRCYSEQEDGTECDWGSVTAWEPPKRFTMAWQISPQWQFEPALERSSEVEVSFTPEPGGRTRVDLEHRFFGRHGAGGDKMRKAVGSPGGWSALLDLFAAAANRVPAIS